MVVAATVIMPVTITQCFPNCVPRTPGVRVALTGVPREIITFL